jgi:type I restriction enzyme, S subunit
MLMKAECLLENFDRIAESPGSISHLRRFILDLAVRGKLVEQDPNDEPASELLKRIQVEKARLEKEGEIKKQKPSSLISVDNEPFSIPKNWYWTRLDGLTSYIQRGKSPKYATHDGFPVISQKCIQWNGLDLSKARIVTKESIESYEKIRFLQDGDLLWNSTGTGTIGRIIQGERT